MHKNKDFGIVSLYSYNWEVNDENFSCGSPLSAAGPLPGEGGRGGREAVGPSKGERAGGERQQPPHLGGWRGCRGDGGWVWLGTDIPQGNDDLHSTNKTIQTRLMKRPGSCTLFCFFPSSSSSHCRAESRSLLTHPPIATVSHLFSALLSSPKSEEGGEEGGRSLLLCSQSPTRSISPVLIV